MAFVLCVVLFRRRQKRQAVFGTVTATCHPEHARIVSPVATHCSNLRARRSFAEKKRLLHLRLQNGSAVLHSGIDILRFSICIGRDEPFGAKPPQAGSHKSLMYLTGSKELFYHKRCKFAFVGVDQIRRRSLRGASTPWFPLFIADALQLRKLRLALRAPSG